MQDPHLASGDHAPLSQDRGRTATVMAPPQVDDPQLLRQLFAHFGACRLGGKETGMEGLTRRKLSFS